MSSNPFILTFGKEPFEVISRNAQKNLVLDAFLSEPSSQQLFMITGIRGSGKTVFMTEIAKKIKAEPNWIKVELSSASDLLLDLLSALASENTFAEIFKKAKINLSFFGVGFGVDNTVPITNTQTALIKMLESLKKKGKKLLICIDEVTPTESMKLFSSAFQIFIREELPVYLLMTGLYENINNLQNEKNLTFLYRAPKIDLAPLNIGIIAQRYAQIFNISEEESLYMALATKGYSFAFQVLGYYTWENGGSYKNAIDDTKAYLEDYVYEKVWSEMSRGDRRLAYGLAKNPSGKAKEIKDFLSMKDTEYSPYRDRLSKRGIIDGKEHGYISFTLPFFEEFVIRNYILTNPKDEA